ncbi:MAG: PEP-CTERM sorting domain-containing protein [Armatimonadetes bacterium]|nr:PEP-CTERM sorting domain-containing protein [Armatimonadota bacterium]
MRALIAAAATFATAAMSHAIVFPTTAHVTNNFIPFGSGTTTMHQVFDGNLFLAQTGGLPALITDIGFAPGLNGTFNLGVLNVNLGYTNRTPGVGPPAGLDIPIAGGGGLPNASGAMTPFFSDAAYSVTIAAANSNNFSEMVLTGTTFLYDPAQGNLLVEIVLPNANNTALHVSRTSGSAESSRAFDTSRFGSGTSPGTATRMDFTFTAVPEPGTMLALGVGLAALATRRRRRK